MYIEDILKAIVAPPFNVVWGKRPPEIKWEIRDDQFIDSLHTQLFYNYKTLTEKQGNALLGVLSKYADEIKPTIPNIYDLLSSPKWKDPFRVLADTTSITVLDSTTIVLKFPYDPNKITSIKSYNKTVHDTQKGQWNGKDAWIFNFTEKAVAFISDNFSIDYADETFQVAYNEIVKVRKNIENYVPMLSKVDGKYTIVNAYKTIPQPDTSDLAEALLFAKKFGITSFSDEIQIEMHDKKISAITKGLLSDNSKYTPIWFDSATTDINNFTDVIKHSTPIIVIVPGGTENIEIRRWTEFALSQGIKPSQISTLFRLPNEKSDFNQYVKETGINGELNDDTKLVFVNIKIPKPLIQSKLRFNTVINLGLYSYTHFTMATMIDNIPNVIYYSLKEPTQIKWPRH